MIDGKIVVTVDLPNAYLTFSDPATKHTTAAALWVASNHRFFFGRTSGTYGMDYYEYDGGDDVPEEVQPSPLPYFTIDDLLVPAADAKLVAANIKAFPNHVTLIYELPRKGTTLVARVDLAEIRTTVRDAALPEPTKAKLLAIIDNQMYSRFELLFRKDTGGFDVGTKSRR
ncbi:MAG TPA: hypothetical protein VGO00_06160 [Kofleriaceae bacterium]|nr:hypothetical protein [Kofleriaceae bacterium]